MQYKTRRFRNTSEKVSHFEINYKLPILNCSLFPPDDRPWEEVEQSNEELLKGVVVEKFSNCISSDGDSECSSDEEVIVPTSVQQQRKRKYSIGMYRQ